MLFNKNKGAVSELNNFFKKTPYKKPYYIQKKLVPVILENKKNIKVETKSMTGKTALSFLPVLLKCKKRKSGTKTIIISNNNEELNKIYSQIKIFSKHARPYISYVLLNEENTVSRNLGKIRSNPNIIISSTFRIIDLIRQENLSTQKLEKIIIIEPDDQDELSNLSKDIDFIYTKIKKKIQTVILSKDNSTGRDLELQIKPLKKINFDDWNSLKCKNILYLSDLGFENKYNLLLDIIITKDLGKTIIYCKNEEIKLLNDKLIKGGFSTGLISSDSINEHNFFKKNDFFLVSITNSLLLSQLDNIFFNSIFFSLPENINIFFNLAGILNQHKGRPDIFFIAEKVNEAALLEEEINMKIKNEDRPEKQDAAKILINKLLDQIKHEEDPEVLNKYKKIFKKNVPLPLRSYFAAYFLKEALKKSGVANIGGGSFNTLFVSIGKNRRVYPNDLARFFSNALRIKPAEIGSIKVLDNYSFIDIPEQHSAEAIKILDGKLYRGRKITVNFAKKKNLN